MLLINPFLVNWQQAYSAVVAFVQCMSRCVGVMRNPLTNGIMHLLECSLQLITKCLQSGVVLSQYRMNNRATQIKFVCPRMSHYACY